ncbi:MAG: hypothetical protein ACRCYV_05740 [Aeromonas sp.]
MQINSTACAQAIAQRFLAKQGVASSLIKVMAPLLLPKINKIAVSMLLGIMTNSPEQKIEQALDIIWPALEQMPLLMDDVADKATAENVPLAPKASKKTTAPSERMKPEPETVEFEEMDADAELDIEPTSAVTAPVVIPHDDHLVQYDREPRSLYPHRNPPPENIDLHLDMPLKTGMFRVLPKGKQPPALDERRVYQLSTPLETGHAYMSLKGPTLNTQMDLAAYICITHWLGRLTKSKFEQAITTPIKMSLDDFFAPIKESMTPSSYLLDKKLVESLARLKSVALLFFPTLNDANDTGRKRSIMIANIVGTLRLEPDGSILISPTPELRTLYLNTNKLVPLNRTALIRLSSQMARLLALWLSVRPGKLLARRIYLNIRPITAGELLREIHPRESGRYNENDRTLLSNALNELMRTGLVEADIEFKNVKAKSSTERLTLTTVITFKSHCIGDAHATEQMPVPNQIILDVPVRKKRQSHPAGEALQALRFPMGRTKPETWFARNSESIELILAACRLAAGKSLLDVRRLFTGVADHKLTSFSRVLGRCGRMDDAALIEQIDAIDPRKKKQSAFETLLRSVPLKPAHVKIEHWYADNTVKIEQLKQQLRKSNSPLDDAASVNKKVYFARLVTPLLALDKKNDAEFFKGMWEAGKEGKESNQRDEWNQSAQTSRRRKVMKI